MHTDADRPDVRMRLEMVARPKASGEPVGRDARRIYRRAVHVIVDAFNAKVERLGDVPLQPATDERGRPVVVTTRASNSEPHQLHRYCCLPCRTVWNWRFGCM